MTTLQKKKLNLWMNRFMAWLIIFASCFLLSGKAYAADIQMGAGGNLVFEPNEVTIKAGDYYFQCDPHAGAGMKGVIHVE